jgi:membrane protein required for beta-lactamase induction
MKSANKVVVNTGILYARMLITMGISLYSTRLVLNALGSVDYGVFNLVAGVIAMLSFFKYGNGDFYAKVSLFLPGEK